MAAKFSSKIMKCPNCSWEWKISEGGSDVNTCHKCGGKANKKLIKNK